MKCLLLLWACAAVMQAAPTCVSGTLADYIALGAEGCRDTYGNRYSDFSWETDSGITAESIASSLALFSFTDTVVKPIDDDFAYIALGFTITPVRPQMLNMVASMSTQMRDTGSRHTINGSDVYEISGQVYYGFDYLAANTAHRFDWRSEYQRFDGNELPPTWTYKPAAIGGIYFVFDPIGPPTEVPEPGSVAMLSVALPLLWQRYRRLRRHVSDRLI